VRHEYLLSRDSSVALLVDLQERLLETIEDRARVLKSADRFVRGLKLLGIPLLVTEQNPAVFGRTAEPVRTALGETPPLSKLAFSCWEDETLRKGIAALGRRQVLVFGLETHICVGQTALDGVAHGYEVHGVFDACGARTAELHQVGVDKMKAGGVIPCSTESALFELLERAGTDEFRKLLPLLKER
jgi:nicotinamidase-related amidase